MGKKRVFLCIALVIVVMAGVALGMGGCDDPVRKEAEISAAISKALEESSISAAIKAEEEAKAQVKSDLISQLNKIIEDLQIKYDELKGLAAELEAEKKDVKTKAGEEIRKQTNVSLGPDESGRKRQSVEIAQGVIGGRKDKNTDKWIEGELAKAVDRIAVGIEEVLPEGGMFSDKPLDEEAAEALKEDADIKDLVGKIEALKSGLRAVQAYATELKERRSELISQTQTEVVEVAVVFKQAVSYVEDNRSLLMDAIEAIYAGSVAKLRDPLSEVDLMGLLENAFANP